jgi:hypothetical protein
MRGGDEKEIRSWLMEIAFHGGKKFESSECVNENETQVKRI